MASANRGESHRKTLVENRWTTPNFAMKSFRGETFRHVNDRDSGRSYENLAFVNCEFQNCALSLTLSDEKRSTVRDVHIKEGTATNCSIGPAIFENVVVDGLETAGGGGGLLLICAAAFRNVVLQGNLGRMLLTSLRPSALLSREQRIRLEEQFRSANEAYFKTVNWALDIRDAHFRECEIRSIPGRLIKRDPITQALVRREKLADGSWRKLDLSGTPWRMTLERLWETQREDAILIAPMRHPRFTEWLAGIQILRHAGIAEPD